MVNGEREVACKLKKYQAENNFYKMNANRKMERREQIGKGE